MKDTKEKKQVKGKVGKVKKMKREKKDQQVNLRFTHSELDFLNYVARLEDRDLSYVIHFLIRVGLKLYSSMESFRVLRSLRIDSMGRVKFGLRMKGGHDATLRVYKNGTK